MDWPKIKSILIIVLLITNIMLGYTYIREQQRFEDEEKNNIEGVIQLFENKGVAINTQNMTFPKSIKSVNVDFETYGQLNVDLLLGNDYSFDGEKYISDNRLVMLGETDILYAYKDHLSRIIQDDLPSLTRFIEVTEADVIDSLKVKVDEFLTNGGYALTYDSMEIRKLGEYTYVLLNQNYDGYLFEESRTLVWFYKDAIVGFNRANTINISSTPGSKYDIISIDRILYTLLPKLQSGDVIESVSVIYKLNDESLLVSDLVLGEALPYYRIVLKSGESYHMRAVVNL
jgi:hypothetical protein